MGKFSAQNQANYNGMNNQNLYLNPLNLCYGRPTKNTNSNNG
jgi:hypothetical protein